MKKILFALLLLLIGTISLWYNESRAIKTAKSIEEVEELLNEGSDKIGVFKLALSAKDSIHDPNFKQKFSGLKLAKSAKVRVVKNKKDKWEKVSLDSIGIDLPSNVELSSGEFIINSKISQSIDDFVAASLEGKGPMFESITFRNKTYKFSALKDNQAVFVDSNNIASLKITYTIVPFGNYTVLGVNEKGQINPYTSSNEREVIFVERGNFTNNEIIKELFSSNDKLTWVLRFCLFILVFFAIRMPMKIITQFSDKIPVLGKVISKVSSLVAFLIAAAISTLVTGAAWLFYRPLISIPLFAITIVGIIFIKKQNIKTHEKI